MFYYCTKENVNPSYDIHAEEWYEKIASKEGAKVLVGVHQNRLVYAFSDAARPYCVTVGRSIYSPYDSQLLGTMLININVHDLQTCWSAFKEDSQERFYLLDDENNVVFSNLTEEIGGKFFQDGLDKLAEIISSGTLGPLRLVQVNFGSYKEYDMNNRFFNRNLAGGAMLDIGVYALSLIRWFFAETANQVLSQVKYAPTGVDEQAGILLMNPAGEMATVTLSLHAKQPKRATIAFDKGYIEIFEYPRAMEATITYTGDGHKETISAGETADALSYEVADMEAAVCSGDLSTIESLMHLNYSQDVMHIMTEIRNNWGMKYPEEE